MVHLAAQAGVRYSVTNPEAYITSNINGYFNILNLSKKFKIKHFVFASSSSVYGSLNKFPLKKIMMYLIQLNFMLQQKFQMN